jgi:hypothetical protein
MKPFWIASLILAAMVTLLLLNAQHLKQLVEPLREELTQAGEYAEGGDWDTAIQITRKVQDAWHSQRLYLHTTLPHANIDKIYLLLEEASAYLEHQKLGEYYAANQSLINQLELLYEMEALTTNNIL